MNLSGISIILLSYNERENLGPAVAQAIQVAKEIAKKHEILIVQYAGSTDGSIEEAQRIAKEQRSVRVLIQAKADCGYGMGLRIGIEHARLPWLFYTDADRQFDLRELHRFLPLIERADMVVGYRINRKDPFGRLLAAWIYNRIMRMVFGVRHPDVDCAFRLAKTSVIKSFPLQSRTGLYVTEILVWAKERKISQASIGVKHYPRLSGEATFQNRFALPKLSVVIALLKELNVLRQRVINDRARRRI